MAVPHIWSGCIQAAFEHQRQECQLACHYRQGLGRHQIWSGHGRRLLRTLLRTQCRCHLRAEAVPEQTGQAHMPNRPPPLLAFDHPLLLLLIPFWGTTHPLQIRFNPLSAAQLALVRIFGIGMSVLIPADPRGFAKRLVVNSACSGLSRF